MGNIIDGKVIAKQIRKNIKNEVKTLKEKLNKTPKLVAILVGDDPASKVYIKSKEKTSKRLGMQSETIFLKDTITEKELLKIIEKLNNDKNVNGILVQLPLPKHINTENILKAIDYKKDIDCFHPYNVGKLFLSEKTFYPCTPNAVLQIIDYENIETKGKDVVIIGRSNIVGKPLSILLTSKKYNSTVTLCHSKTENIKEKTKNADIVIAAAGQPMLVKQDWLKDGCTVIDVGINRLDNKIVGDVDFEDCCDKCSKITPVPGGVGPLTIACLLLNTLDAFKEQNSI